MSGNITFSMIKPDAVRNQYIGQILAQMTEAGFQIKAMKLTQLTVNQARAFYAVHKERPFYNDLVEFMTSGPVVALLLEKDNAVEDFRTLIGSTDPTKADKGTIRERFAESIQNNAVHGSDSDENAIIESDFFFSKLERV
jgi:nucleoside-diphosphate kinase